MMNPKRFQFEEEYYDNLLQTYQDLLKDNQDIINGEYTANEIIQIMKELKEREVNLQDNENLELDLMRNITRNILVLLLSLFEKKDESCAYKDVDDLDTCEREILKTQLNLMLN